MSDGPAWNIDWLRYGRFAVQEVVFVLGLPLGVSYFMSVGLSWDAQPKIRNWVVLPLATIFGFLKINIVGFAGPCTSHEFWIPQM